MYFSPQSSAGGIGFYAATDAGGSTNSFSIDDITVKEAPKHDLLIHNQILRISDGSFNSSNDSKWYGHIKINFFGGGITYGTSSDGYKFRQPPMAVAKNSWVSEKTELTAPTVVPMKYAFDQNNDVDAANEVGIFVHFPAASANDVILIPNTGTDNTFSSKDKYTVTFIYDYVQESELGRDANGDVGVYAQNAPTGSGQTCPGIQLVPFTNTSGNFTGGTGWNQRITGINLYWQPKDDIDWYLVTTYDCNEGFSEDPRAKDSATDTVLSTGTTEKSNNGYWIPCMEPYGASGDYYENINAATINTFTESDGGGSWGTAFSADNMVFVYPDNSITSLADVAGKLKETSTIICNIKSVSGSTLTTGTLSTAVSWKNWSGEGGPDPFTMSSARAFAATVSTDKVATWYIPNDGLKLATYNSLTGRAAETRLKPIKWNTSAVVGNKAFYANIDFKDENDQTLREKNRIVFTDNFKLDEAVVGTKFVDVGKNDGDEITALHSAQGRLYVFKTRNIYIYRIQSAQSVNFILERHIAGVGCLHKHAITETPYGLCFMDRKQISLLRGTEISELSLLIRDTYQTLGESMHQGDGSIMIGYDPILNMLVFSYALNAQIMYGYNFDTQSWVKLDMSSIPGSQSNMIINNNQRLQTYDTNSKRVENLFTGSVGAANLLLKTKRYDFGSPETFKRFTKLHITFKASTTPYFKIYIDGSDTSEGQRGLDTFTTLNTHSAVLNHLGKTIEVEVYGISTDFRIDGIDIDYDIEGSNP